MRSLISSSATLKSLLSSRGIMGRTNWRFASTVTPEQPQSPDQQIPAIQADRELRLSAIKLYKELHRLGRDYPDPAYEFNKRLRRIFEKNAKLTSVQAVKEQLAMGEHVKKEVLAMLSLKKFRHLRRSYYANDGPR